MADTINDIVISNEDWVDVSTETGIASGSSVTIQNKGVELVLLWISNTKPSADSEDGIIIYTLPHQHSIKTIKSGHNKLWLKTLSSNRSSKVNVSEEI